MSLQEHDGTLHPSAKWINCQERPRWNTKWTTADTNNNKNNNNQVRRRGKRGGRTYRCLYRKMQRNIMHGISCHIWYIKLKRLVEFRTFDLFGNEDEDVHSVLHERFLFVVGAEVVAVIFTSDSITIVHAG